MSLNKFIVDLTVRTGNSPEVSIIIPNYNHGKYLRQRIDSVLNQTFKNFEVIILDDCSTDNSVQVIEGYRNHPKVSTIIINTENSGSPFLQWKKGMDIAQGEWIWIAESDDWCECNFLETLMKEIDPGVALAFCQTIFVNENGEKIWEPGWFKLSQKMDGKNFITDHLSKGNFITNASMCIFRKRFYYQVSEEFLQYKFSGDWVFWIEIASQGDVIICEKALNYFRKHGADVSSKAYRQGLQYYEYFSFLNKVGDANIIPESIRTKVYSYKFYEFLNDKRVEGKYRKPLFKEFYSKLGLRLYFLQVKNFLNVKIKRPIKNAVK